MIKPFEISLELEQPKNANVADMYKNWTLAEIRADLDSRRTPLVNICLNLTGDFNKSSVIRANNSFLGDSVYMVGKRKYNRTGSVGSHVYEHVYSADTLSEVVDLMHERGYTVFAVDNIMEYNPVNLWDSDLPEKSAFVYGEEQRGLQSEDIELCDGMIYVAMTGSVRSLNVAQCAATIMSEYSRRHRL